jgi:hypothetical protein
MKLVADSRGGAETVTVNEQGVAVRPTESRALQVTVEFPNGKTVPLAGEQLKLSGGSPAIICGGSYSTLTPAPSGEVTVTGKGQTRIGPSVEGVTPPPPHPAAKSALRKTRR